MPRYQITMYRGDAQDLLKEVCSMNPFPIEVREQAWGRNVITLTLTQEEYVFLSLKYEMISSHERTIVDVVGDIING